MIEVVCNDRLGKKIRVKCNEDDTIGDMKKLLGEPRGPTCSPPTPTSPLLPHVLVSSCRPSLELVCP